MRQASIERSPSSKACDSTKTTSNSSRRCRSSISNSWTDYATCRFSGDVWAPPEGTIVYPHEPLIQVIAPLPEAQIVETALINQIAYPTLVASKAARAVDAAAGRPIIEFGGRRAHGSEAAIEASRATYIAGFEATSSVEAGRRHGIPTTGTMAHSFVLAEGDEAASFDAFVSLYPGTTLLVDTFEIPDGVTNAIRTAKRHGPGSVGAIRIDSGNLHDEAWQARIKLDTAGMSDIRIVASGGLDEYRIADLVSSNAPIDIFACGTSIVAPPDAATLDSAYKMVEYEGRPVAKRSPGKPSIGHRKQVWRLADHDLIARVGDRPSDADPVLQHVMSSGQRDRSWSRFTDPDTRSRGRFARPAPGGDRSFAANMKSRHL